MTAPVSGGLYQIMNNKSQTVLSLAGNPGANNPAQGFAPVFPLGKTGGPSAQQVWALKSQAINGKEYWTVVNAFHPNVLTLDDGNSSDGTNISIQQNENGDNQLWEIVMHRNTLNSLPGPQWCTFVNKKTGTCADLFHSDPADGTPVQGWAVTDNNPHQAWILIPCV